MKRADERIRLTPFREIASVQEMLKEDRVELLRDQIEIKFGIARKMSEGVAANLMQLDMNALKALFKQLLRLDTFEQLELWISDHLPERIA